MTAHRQRLARVLLLAMTALTALTAACTTTSADFKARSAQYARLASQPTPEHWTPGAVWVFVTTTGNGGSLERRFQLTDEPVQTCSDGSWHRLIELDAAPRLLAGQPVIASARADGRNLHIALSNWCDISHGISGALDGGDFVGEEESGGMTGSSRIGAVHGSRVK